MCHVAVSVHYGRGNTDIFLPKLLIDHILSQCSDFYDTKIPNLKYQMELFVLVGV